MKTIITSAVCSSLLLLAACNNNTESTETTKQEVLAMQKTALASGIDKANMDLSVRPQDNSTPGRERGEGGVGEEGSRGGVAPSQTPSPWHKMQWQIHQVQARCITPTGQPNN